MAGIGKYKGEGSFTMKSGNGKKKKGNGKKKGGNGNKKGNGKGYKYYTS